MHPTAATHRCHPPWWVVQWRMLVVGGISGGWLWWVVAVGVRAGGLVVLVGSDGCWWQLCCWVAIADVGLGCCLTVLVWPIPPKKVKKKVGLKWLKMDFKGMFFCVDFFLILWHPPTQMWINPHFFEPIPNTIVVQYFKSASTTPFNYLVFHHG